MIVKHGDRYDVTYTVNYDLTGTTIRLLARRLGTPTAVELVVAGVAEGSVTDPVTGEPVVAGVITHALTGTLPTGDYQVEVEVTTTDGEVVTFPTDQEGNRLYDMLHIVPDLG